MVEAGRERERERERKGLSRRFVHSMMIAKRNAIYSKNISKVIACFS